MLIVSLFRQFMLWWKGYFWRVYDAYLMRMNDICILASSYYISKAGIRFKWGARNPTNVDQGGWSMNEKHFSYESSFESSHVNELQLGRKQPIWGAIHTLQYYIGVGRPNDVFGKLFIWTKHIWPHPNTLGTLHHLAIWFDWTVSAVICFEKVQGLNLSLLLLGYHMFEVYHMPWMKFALLTPVIWFQRQGGLNKQPGIHIFITVVHFQAMNNRYSPINDKWCPYWCCC